MNIIEQNNENIKGILTGFDRISYYSQPKDKDNTKQTKSNLKFSLFLFALLYRGYLLIVIVMLYVDLTHFFYKSQHKT